LLHIKYYIIIALYDLLHDIHIQFFSMICVYIWIVNVVTLVFNHLLFIFILFTLSSCLVITDITASNHNYSVIIYSFVFGCSPFILFFIFNYFILFYIIFPFFLTIISFLLFQFLIFAILNCLIKNCFEVSKSHQNNLKRKKKLFYEGKIQKTGKNEGQIDNYKKIIINK